MTSDLFTQDAKLTPYWWDRTPRPELPPAPPPAKAEVVVIGSGYTGLSAALQTARGGRDTWCWTPRMPVGDAARATVGRSPPA